MVRRVFGILLILLGATSIVLGVLSATSWRTSDRVTATTTAADVPLVLIEPGVAGIVNPIVDVTITPAEPTQTVTLITARDTDAEGWIGDAAVQRVEDLADWTELVTTTTDGTQEIPDPAVSDMWLSVEQAQGPLELTGLRAPQDRTVLLIARDGASGPAPTVSFTWQREVATPYLMPLVGAGIAAAVLGIGLVVSSFVGGARRRGAGASDPEDRDTVILGRVTGAAAGGADPDDRETVILPGPAAGKPPTDDDGADDEPVTLTRRELRALRAKAQEADLEVIAAGIAPTSDELASPDAPDAYPSWLRAQEGAAASSSAQASGSPTEAWRRRWGVAASDDVASDDVASDDVASDDVASDDVASDDGAHSGAVTDPNEGPDPKETTAEEQDR